jgi:3-hydroxybutyryl-CoA dehydrogenase
MNNALPNIGIIGEGKMGTNIFYYLLDFGFPMVWVTSNKADTEKIQKSFQKKIKRSLDSGIIDESGFNFRTKNIRITNQLTDLSNCDLIIEAIPEELKLKQEIFHNLDLLVQPDCIFATNSSSVNPSLLFPPSSRKDKIIGLHFFYPVSLKNIVELIITSQTSHKTIDFAEQFLTRIKREYLQLDEVNSFILNKIFLEFQNEAFLIVNEGKATIQQMDNLIIENFFPFGVFSFMDSVGINTMLASILNYTRDYPDKTKYQPLISKLKEMSQSGRMFIPVDKNENDNHNQIPSQEILIKLRFSMQNAIRVFTKNSGLPSEKITSALNEYFGVDVSHICLMIPE